MELLTKRCPACHTETIKPHRTYETTHYGPRTVSVSMSSLSDLFFRDQTHIFGRSENAIKPHLDGLRRPDGRHGTQCGVQGV